MADEKKEEQQDEEAKEGKKYDGGKIPKATKAAIKAREEAESN